MNSMGHTCEDLTAEGGYVLRFRVDPTVLGRAGLEAEQMGLAGGLAALGKSRWERESRCGESLSSNSQVEVPSQHSETAGGACSGDTSGVWATPGLRCCVESPWISTLQSQEVCKRHSKE